MEYTQEQLDAVIADAKKGLFSEDELTRRVTSEVDRRVESGIQKGLETNKLKWKEEYEKTANLSAEELAQRKFKEAEEKLTAKEREINRKANLTDAKELLTGAGVPKAQYDKVVSMLVTDDSETTKSNVQNFIDTFTTMKSEIETQVKESISKIPPPNQNDNNKVVSKAEFDKLGFTDKLAFKKSNPEMYKEFLK